MGNYLLIALGWVATCIVIGVYISGAGMKGNRHYTLGLKILLLSYLAGICMLGIMIMHS